ncbi:MAG: aminodeoxychorismate/anthranilate synthase component II [Bacteroidota bacterium]|nr:aminodeoxychorismate/anthranilate synthase component II [Bacteroidota bacterium]
MKLLLLDNFDSFTYNLFHYLEEFVSDITVRRNDELLLEDVAQFDKIVLGPGPGVPSQAGVLKPLIKHYASSKSILGVCLGQQAIAEVFGGKLKKLEQVTHGVEMPIDVIVDDEVLFEGLPRQMQVGRYHSWVVNQEGFPSELEVTAIDEHTEIMALRHRFFDVRAVQFHPESIMTPMGKQLLQNWVKS